MSEHTKKSSSDGESLTDPVCGMTVTEETGHRHVHEGKEYLFCSD